MAVSVWYEFKAAVQTKLTGDATLVALLGTSPAIYEALPKTAYGGQYPFIAKDFRFSRADSFTGAVYAVDFDVQVRLESDGTYSTDSPLTRMDLILRRVLGDWDAQSTRVPTFGLDHWTPGALSTSGYYADTVMVTGGPLNVQHDEVIGEVVSFRSLVSKTAGA